MIIKKKEIFVVILQTFFLVSVVMFSVVPFSCKVTEEGIEIIGGDYENPCLQNVSVVDGKTVELQFSDSIVLRDLVVSKFIEGVSDSDEHSESICLSPSLAAACGEYGKINVNTSSSDDGKTITFIFDKETEIGSKYEVFGTVEDAVGNSLTFCVPFTGFNSFVPRMIITEAQIKYGKGSSSGETIYRAEFVELMALEDGNLSGLELLSASDGEEKKFVFPAIDVKKGEIILVHPRTKEGGCINEDGDDLNLATAPHSKDGVRDLWSENLDSRYNDSTDVIYLRNSVDNSVMDVLLYAAEGSEEWKSNVQEIVNLVCGAGLCNSSEISEAVVSKGVSPLKSLTRLNAPEIFEKVMNGEEIDFPLVFEASDWAVCGVTSGGM